MYFTEEEKNKLFEEFMNYYTANYDDGFSVRREQIIETTDFQVGDKIDFTLTTGEEVTVVAIKEVDDGMLFVFKNCVSESGRDDIYQYMNGKLLATMPKKIRDRMIGKFRLLTEREVFGKNEYGEEEKEEQIPYFKERQNRVATVGNNNDGYQWWWLETKVKDSIVAFVSVSYYGLAYYNYTSDVGGVRPCFVMKKS